MYSHVTRAEPDGTRAETTFHLSPKRTSPFKSVGESVQSTAGSRGVRISVSNAGYTTFRGRVRVLATHSIRQFPLHFPSHASPCATTFRTQYKKDVTANIMFSAIHTPHTKSEEQYHLQYSILCIGSLYSCSPFFSPTINSIFCLVFPLYFSSTKIFPYS